MKRIFTLLGVVLFCSVGVSLPSSTDRAFWTLEEPVPHGEPISQSHEQPHAQQGSAKGIRLNAGDVFTISLGSPIGKAYAGESFLGSIVSAAGADTTNATTAVPFVITPAGVRLSIQCNATAYVAVDDLTAVTSARGVTVVANTLFLTKVDMPVRAGVSQKVVISSTTSAVVRIAGPAAVTCNVWRRMGDE